MRVLGAARLSHLTDESTSIARQREQITLTVRAREGWSLTGIAEDSDVSGAVPPFAREQLGPWLSDPSLIASWDILMVAKLDRLTRSLRDFDDLRLWCDQHGKTIVSVAESLDLSTPAGRMFANLLAMFAQFERERMSERRSEAARKLNRDGKLNTGDWSVRYGYRRGPEGHPEIVPHEAEVIRRLVACMIKGETLAAVCETFAQERVPTRRGGSWKPSQAAKMMRRLRESYARGADGTPYYYPEIVSAAELETALLALDGRSFRGRQKLDTTRHDAALLLRVAFCREGHPLYAMRLDERRRYYRCRECRLSVSMSKLDAVAGESIIAGLGGISYMEPVFVPATGAGAELESVIRTMDDVESQVAAGQLPVASAARVLSTLQARRDELEKIPVAEARWELQKTGKTVEEEWDGGGWAKRRRLLTHDLQVKMTVWKESKKLRVRFQCSAMIPDEWFYEE